jgi:hypothetical protein
MFLRPTVLSFSLLIVVTCCTVSSAQEDIRWKLQSGETLKYEVVQKTSMETEIGKQKRSQTMQQTMDMAWVVGNVSPEGDAALSQSIERVQFRMKDPAVGDIAFDTQADEEPENPLAASLARTYQKIIGQQFHVRMKPTGKVDNVEMPADLIKSVRESKGPLTEETLKQTMEQTSITLPSEPVVKGTSWDSVRQIDLGYGRMKNVSKMTYTGKDPSTGLAVIQMQSTITITPKEGSPTQLSIRDSEGEGQTLFDIDKGRIVKSALDITMKMEVIRGGQSVEQIVHQNAVMQLTSN